MTTRYEITHYAATTTRQDSQAYRVRPCYQRILSALARTLAPVNSENCHEIVTETIKFE